MTDQSRNLNPTPPAVAAMFIYADEYGNQKGGSMDFWDSLPPWKRKVCEEAVARITEAAGRARVSKR